MTSASPHFMVVLTRMMASEMPLIVSLIFGGCCSNVFSLEVIVKDVPNSGQLATLGQFLFVSLEGLRHHVDWQGKMPRLKPTKVPLSRWTVIVLLFFAVTWLNNMAFGYGISMPLHIIFRSGGLFANMVMGALLLGKRYPREHVIGVGLVTVGVVCSTLDHVKSSSTMQDQSTGEFVVGISVLVAAVVLSAGMGLLQEEIYTTYGKHWREGLFYTHFLALPFFAIFYKDILENVATYNASGIAPLPTLFSNVPLLGALLNSTSPWPIQTIMTAIKVPKLWAFWALNILTQYVCIAGVNQMTATAPSLTLHLVLNLRKFTSLLISIVYFDNEFGMGAKAGTAFVLLGTIVYSHSSITHRRRTNASYKMKS